MIFKDLKPGDKVILHTGDSRYKDEIKIIKSVGHKWIKLEFDYPKVKYSVLDGQANDERPGYSILIPKTGEEEAWEETYSYLIREVVPRYLKTLSIDKLKYLQRRWTNKILKNDENNSTV